MLNEIETNLVRRKYRIFRWNCKILTEHLFDSFSIDGKPRNTNFVDICQSFGNFLYDILASFSPLFFIVVLFFLGKYAIASFVCFFRLYLVRNCIVCLFITQIITNFIFYTNKYTNIQYRAL